MATPQSLARRFVGEHLLNSDPIDILGTPAFDELVAALAGGAMPGRDAVEQFEQLKAALPAELHERLLSLVDAHSNAAAVQAEAAFLVGVAVGRAVQAA